MSVFDHFVGLAVEGLKFVILMLIETVIEETNLLLRVIFKNCFFLSSFLPSSYREKMRFERGCKETIKKQYLLNRDGLLEARAKSTKCFTEAAVQIDTLI